MTPTAVTPRNIRERTKENETGCWEWQATLTRAGYARVSFFGRIFQAHRLSYLFFVGGIPAGMVVCHRCDNPRCINPDHLFIGTHQDNVSDCAAKGRRFTPRAKFTPEQLDDMCSRYSAGESVNELADLFGVWDTSIRRRLAKAGVYKPKGAPNHA